MFLPSSLLLRLLTTLGTSNIIDATTSTLGSVLESRRSITQCLANATADITNDTADGVYGACYRSLAFI